MAIVLKRGAEATTPGKSGLAALVARMLTESTRRRNAFQLAEAAETFGSTLQSSAQRDLIEVALESLPGDTNRAIELLSEVVREPGFSSGDFERVRSQWLDDLMAERQSPNSLAALTGIRALFGTYRGAPVNGSVSDVKGLALADLKAWHAKYVVPSNAALVVVGPIQPESVVRTARNSFEHWRAASLPEKAAEYPTQSQSSKDVIVIDRKDAVQSAVFAVQEFPRRLSAGHESRLLLNDIFGGLFTSRINMNLREAHAYTYGAHSTVVANRNFGAFIIQTNVKTDVTAASLTEIIGELSALASPKVSRPIQQDELARARADLIHRLGARLEQNRYLVNDLETVFIQDLSPNYYSILPGIYSQLNSNEIAAQASLIKPDSFTIVVVGDRKRIEPALVQAGFNVKTAESAWLD
jgi:zinc protease